MRRAAIFSLVLLWATCARGDTDPALERFRNSIPAHGLTEEMFFAENPERVRAPFNNEEGRALVYGVMEFASSDATQNKETQYIFSLALYVLRGWHDRVSYEKLLAVLEARRLDDDLIYLAAVTLGEVDPDRAVDDLARLGQERRFNIAEVYMHMGALAHIGSPRARSAYGRLGAVILDTSRAGSRNIAQWQRRRRFMLTEFSQIWHFRNPESQTGIALRIAVVTPWAGGALSFLTMLYLLFRKPVVPARGGLLP
jgi:hypothetical protein